jgi:hypothetical protein
MSAAVNISKYRTTKPIIVPAHTNVIFISHIRQDSYRLAQALITINPDLQYEWNCGFDAALKAGLIERVE